VCSCIAPTPSAPMPHRNDSALNVDPWYAICNTPQNKYNMQCPQKLLTNLASRIFPGACVALQLISRALREGARQRPAFCWLAPSLSANSRLVAQANADHVAPLWPSQACCRYLPARCRSVGVPSEAQFARPRHAVQTETHDTDRGKRTLRVRRPTSAVQLAD
jgi:hypothetical protein